MTMTIQLKHASASDLLEHCDPRDLVELVCRLVPLLDRDKVLEAIKAEQPNADASIEGTPEL